MIYAIHGLPGIIRRARCDELKDLGCWKSRNMVDRYAKFTTENLAFAASRIESDKGQQNHSLITFRHVKNAGEKEKPSKTSN